MVDRYRHFELEPLADGAWAALHRTAPPVADGWAISNAGIVDLGDRTLVFDTFMTSPAADELRSAAESLTGRPPGIVVLSHAHNDHAWGASRFAGATIMSSAAARAELDAEGPAEMADYRAVVGDRLARWTAAAEGDDPDERQDAAFFLPYWQGLAECLPALELRLPDVTVEGRLEVHGTGRRAELMTVARAHTGGDLVMILPEERIVFCGDLLFVGCHPYLGDGDLGGLRRALAMLATRSAGRFVPGHGPVGGAAELTALTAYLDDVERLATVPGAVGIPDAYCSWGLRRFFAANLAFAGSPPTAGG